MFFRKRRKLVAISALADYAEDPVLHVRTRGGVRNAAAVRVGRRRHFDAGWSGIAEWIKRVGIALLVAGALVLLVVYGGAFR